MYRLIAAAVAVLTIQQRIVVTASCSCGSSFLMTDGSGIGYLKSPNYPNAYCGNLDCTYYLFAFGMDIELKFDTFDLESGYDFLYIYCGAGASTDSLVETCTGGSCPSVVCSSQYVTVVLRTDYSVEGTGFLATFYGTHAHSTAAFSTTTASFPTTTVSSTSASSSFRTTPSTTIPRTSTPTTIPTSSASSTPAIETTRTAFPTFSTTISSTTITSTTASHFTSGRPTTTTPSSHGNTGIFLYLNTYPGQDLFIRGGISGLNVDPSMGYCPYPPTASLESDECSISIVHETNSSSDEYNAWKVGDNYLDWYGAEAGQGSYQGVGASGTPLTWTTNDSNDPLYEPLNTFGPNYWFVLLNINCSLTKDGWFEFKGYEPWSSSWEGDRNQKSCAGTAGGTAPFPSNNHVARCGFLNVFSFNSDHCLIDSLSV